MACLVANNQSQVIKSIKSKKCISILIKMSVYEQDIDWYTEDEGISVVNINKTKSLPITAIEKYENKINKLETAISKKMQKEESER